MHFFNLPLLKFYIFESCQLLKKECDLLKNVFLNFFYKLIYLTYKLTNDLIIYKICDNKVVDFALFEFS